jgi:hypothetical protein
VKPDDRRALDPRRAADFHAELLARRAAYLAAWSPAAAGPDAALVWIAARYLEAIATRLDRAPEKNRLAFFDLLGVERIPAQEARVPLVFTLGDQAVDVTVPEGAQVAAPPPPGSSQQIVFETEQAAGLAAARLASVVSLWPGRDQAIDHGADLAAGQPITPWDPARLADTPHALYIAHDTLLAFSGQTRLTVALELATAANPALDAVWEYWDGAVWRGFAGMRRLCGEAERRADGTAGFTASGRIELTTDCAETARTTVGGIAAFWIRGRLDQPLPIDPARVLPQIAEVKLAVSVAVPVTPEGAAAAAPPAAKPAPGEAPPPARGPAPPPGLLPDKALSGAEVLDTSKSFFPLGQSPKPGDALYLASAEILSKPGAVVTVRVAPARTPADEVAVSAAQALAHELAWEYWDGAAWRELPIEEVHPAQLSSSAAVTRADGVALITDAASASGGGAPSPDDFTGGGTFSFRVPDDLSAVTVHGEEALWVRARLVSGGYGTLATVKFQSTDHDPNVFTYVLPRPPALAELRLGYTWEHGPYVPEHVLTYNDFAYRDRSEEARWPGHPFPPFETVSGETPALYLGFDKRLPVDRLNLYFDVAERRGDTVGPDLVWEYWDGIAWGRLAAEDGTSRLRVPGMVSLIGPEDAAAAARFGDAALYWLRARLREDGPPGAPSFAGIYPNAVWASQRQTVANESLGTALGAPRQVLAFRQFPVLAGEQVEVRELAGARADVEWRIVAQELFGDDPAAPAALEAMLAAEGRETELTRGALRLRRDRNKRVTEVWVRWEWRRNLLRSGPGDRHYALDRTRGRLRLGDGEHGRVPPAGAAIIARRYQTGGGSQGNVAAGAAKQLLAGIPGVQEVKNPTAAEGGADAETLSALGQRAPATLRRRGRVTTAADFAALARETSPAVSAAWALPTLDAGGRRRPGWVTLIVIPESAEPQPWPSFGLREEIRRALDDGAEAEASAALHLHVTGPDYLEIDVAATVAAADPTAAGTVEQLARAALSTFLHPLAGGPEGAGWAPGRGVFLSDLATALARVPGVDHVEELALAVAGRLQGEQVAVPAGRVAAAGTLRLRVV